MGDIARPRVILESPTWIFCQVGDPSNPEVGGERWILIGGGANEPLPD